jgi:hypothetical protein
MRFNPKISALEYCTRPCHYDPYHDKIAQLLEDSYIKNIQGNGKIMLTLFLDDDYEGKCDMFL